RERPVSGELADERIDCLEVLEHRMNEALGERSHRGILLGFTGPMRADRLVGPDGCDVRLVEHLQRVLTRLAAWSEACAHGHLSGRIRRLGVVASDIVSKASASCRTAEAASAPLLPRRPPA